jgi:hypothetical protein
MNQIILNRVSDLKESLFNNSKTLEQVIDELYIIESDLNFDFSVLYNMLYSSRPEIYLN